MKQMGKLKILIIIYSKIMENKYSKDVEVVADNFNLKDNLYVKNVNKKGLLLVYAPWCGFCQMLTPEWKNFVKKFGKKYTIKALNVENKKGGNGHISEKLGVNGFPTIMYIDENGKIGSVYEGERNVEAFDDYLSKK